MQHFANDIRGILADAMLRVAPVADAASQASDSAPFSYYGIAEGSLPLDEQLVCFGPVLAKDGYPIEQPDEADTQTLEGIWRNLPEEELPSTPWIRHGAIMHVPMVGSTRQYQPANRWLKVFTTRANWSEQFVLGAGIERSLFAQQRTLSNLDKGWDGYGSDPLDSGAVTEFIATLRSLLIDAKYRGPLPDLIPGADGSIQLEIHSSQVEIAFGLDKHVGYYFYCSKDASELPPEYGSRARAQFKKIISQVFGERDGGGSYSTIR